MGGVLALAERGEQVGGRGDAVFVGDAAQVLVVDLAQRNFEFAGLALQQLAADFDGAAALVFVEPVLDLVAGAGAFDEGQPVAAGLVIFLGDDFDDVAGAQLGAQGRHAAVDLGADAGVADLGVDGVGEIDRRAVGGDDDNLSLGREGVDLVGVEVHLQAGEELVGVGHLLLPLDELANPVEALLVAGGDDAAAGLVLPVGGDALLGDAVHLFGADLHLELMAAGAHHRGVEGLVAVGAGHGDEVFDAPRHRPPKGVDEAEDGVAGGYVLGDDADGQQIIDLVEGDFGALLLLEDGVDALDAPLDAGLDVVFAQLLGERVFDAAQELLALDAAAFDGGRDLLIADRVGVAEGQIFELAAHFAHAQAVSERGVDVQSFAGDGLAALGLEVLQGAHIMEAVGKFDEHDAHIGDHGQQHLADVFRLAVFAIGELDLVDVGDALDDAGNLRAEAGLRSLRWWRACLRPSRAAGRRRWRSSPCAFRPGFRPLRGDGRCRARRRRASALHGGGRRTPTPCESD